MMELSEEKMLELFQEHQFCMKIFEKRYRRLPHVRKEEMRQAAQIGIWKGICDCFQKAESDEEVSEKLKNCIYSHMKWEIASALKRDTLVHIPGELWSDFKKTEKFLEETPDVTEEKIQKWQGSEHNLERYRKIKSLTGEIKSLNFIRDDSGEETIGAIIWKKDERLEQIIERDHLRYLITSALFAIERERDKNIIIDWLKSVYLGKKITQEDLGRKNNISHQSAAKIIRRFKEICIFLEQNEKRLTVEGAETLRFYKAEESRETQLRHIAANEKGGRK